MVWVDEDGFLLRPLGMYIFKNPRIISNPDVFVNSLNPNWSLIFFCFCLRSWKVNDKVLFEI